MRPNVEDNISICIGTVRRPYCIQRFITSARANYPRIPIVVGDQDKQNPYLHSFYEASGVKVVYVAEDAGVGVARHAAIAQVKTEYILFCDDDFIFSNETRLDTPLRILEHDHEVDIVGGQVKDLIGGIDAPFSTIRRWEHFFTLDRKRRILLTANIDSFVPRKREVDGISYFLADRVLNWKLVRKTAFERGAGWDPRFKCNGEHDDFYLNIKENTDIGVAYCPDLRVYHHSPEDYSYATKREDQEGVRKFAEKWGLDEVLDADSEQTRLILARGFVHTPPAETADPAWMKHNTVVPVGNQASGPLHPETWPASQCSEKPSELSDALQVFFAHGAEDVAVRDGSKFSLLVAVENTSGRRIGCLGETALSLSYRVRRKRGFIAVKRGRITALVQDLTPGVTFHYVNVVVDWDAPAGAAFELDVDLLSPQTGWLNRHASLMLKGETAATPAGAGATPSARVIDFRQPKFPDFLIRTDGLSGEEDWGRWSDANLSDAVLLRFFQPLPIRFRLEITCKATELNTERPVRVQIGQCVREFSPSTSEATYSMDFTLDRAERNLKLYPSCPTSPSSLDASSPDHRRLGIGLVKLKLIPREMGDLGDWAAPCSEGPAIPAREEVAVIDFRRRELPDSLVQVQGLSDVEDWGRWSDANLADAVTLRFFDALPKTLRLELTCLATGPNAGRPVVVEIGASTRAFTPTTSLATYEIDFALDRAERTIKFYPAAPTSPASLDADNQDHRRLGIGFLELTLISDERAGADARNSSSPLDLRPNREEAMYWEGFYSREDPWGYKGEYEQQKYLHTLELLPEAPIGRALEIGCSEGLFSEMLAPRVGVLLGLDIAESALSRARERCRRFANTSFECADISGYFPAGTFDLVVCSETLYYLRDRFALKKVVRRIAQSLAPSGHLVMAHVNSVSDDRTVTGFDFSEIGAVFIGQEFAGEPEFEFLKELRTPLYRVQLFRRREPQRAGYDEPPEIRKSPREVMERPATFAHPLLKWGGCAVTLAEARYLYDTVEVPILMYHRIASDGPIGLAPYRIDPAAFERQLDYLRRHGYSTTNVDDIWQFNCDPNSRMHGKWIALTFDDGYEDFADVAWPLLQRYGFTATVFLPTDHVGGRVEWDRDYGEPAHLMGWETIRRVANQGVSFGSHSCSHRRLTSLAPADLAKEVRLSRRILGEELGVEPRGFCFPYTDFNPAVMAAVSEAGYDYALAGAVPDHAGRNRFALPRIEIRDDDDLSRFVAKLPPSLASSKQMQDEYRRMRAVRHRELYPTITGSTTIEEEQAGPASITSDDAWTGSGVATRDDVIRLYRELLVRDPESDAVLEARVGRPVIEVALDIALSKEFFARVAALSTSSGATREEVIHLFGLLLGRKPESDAVIEERVGSPILALVTEIANSSEFSELGATRAQTAADIVKLHELLLPDDPIELEIAAEIARIAEFHHVRLPAIARHMMAMNWKKLAAHRGESFADSRWTEPSFGKFQQHEAFGDSIELVIPTFNSERWLGPFLAFYRSNEIRVVYAVDSRTSDGTRELVRKYGFPLIEVQGAEARVESILPSIAAQIATPWILRVDDDELPTPKLMDFAAAVACGDSVAAYTFPRADYRRNPLSGRLERSYFFAFGIDGGLDRQGRLHRPDSVAYHDELHSSGFLPKMEIRAPDDVYLLHFDWIVRSERARRRKFESYEKQSPLVARNCKHCALYELVPENWHLFGEVRDDKLQEFARSLAHNL